jgi:hypothetical protein
MAQLQVKKRFVVSDRGPGGYRLTPYDPDFEHQLKLVEESMHDDRQVLRVSLSDRLALDATRHPLCMRMIAS